MIRLLSCYRGYLITAVQINSAVSTRELAKNFRKVDSSNIYAVAYDAESRTMLIRFHKGGVPSSTYVYYDVPPNIAKGFATKPSKGKHFWKTMRNNPRIQYQRLKGNL
jgi:hypothetical protein